VKQGETPAARNDGAYLYRNTGRGSFVDVTSQAGLSNPYWGTGANAADVNNDGYPDILITTIGRDLLYLNRKDGTFREAGRAWGLNQTMHWHTGSTIGDFDGDGLLDLYVAGYVALNALAFSGTPPVCLYRGVPGFCGPMGLKGEPDILYRNTGDGKFADVTERAGVSDKALYHGFAALFHDFNGDGRPDIFVANDSDPNYLYINRGDGTFQESGLISGISFNEDGNTMANMGIALGDYDGDGLIDFLTTDFSEDYFPLYRQTKPGLYEDVSRRLGLATMTWPWVGWAAGFTDFDNDGRKELWTSNGHVYPKAGLLPTTSYLQPFAVFRNLGERFELVRDAVEQPRQLSHRGACAGDFDNDGRPDVAVVPLEAAPLLLHNVTTTKGAWIGFRLIGTKSNRDGFGSVVSVVSCGKTQVSAVVNGGSYLSQNDPRAHFGLGACPAVDEVQVRWPGGGGQVLKKPQPNRYHTVREPS
jgi:hypothetical protein